MSARRFDARSTRKAPDALAPLAKAMTRLCHCDGTGSLLLALAGLANEATHDGMVGIPIAHRSLPLQHR